MSKDESVGVEYEQAAPVLVLEKYGLLGRKKIGLEKGGVPRTDGNII